ncbi:MAG: hypothetical protein WCK14_03745 [Actinomycetota bacterium]|jgi:hypothetical protein
MSTALLRKRMIRTVAAISAAAVLTACGSSTRITTAEPTTVGTAPSGLLAFTSPIVGGGQIDAASFIGKPVAFWFWAPG